MQRPPPDSNVYYNSRPNVDDTRSWLAAHLTSSPLYKRTEELRRRMANQQQDGEAADWDANGQSRPTQPPIPHCGETADWDGNGWADNNVRIWG